MLSLQTLQRKLKDLSKNSLISIHGPWVRAIRYHHLIGPKSDPFYPYGPVKNGARFTPRDGFTTIYMASDQITASLETKEIFKTKDYNLSTPPHFIATYLPVNGVLTDVLDLTDKSIQKSLKTNENELSSPWLLSQEKLLKYLKDKNKSFNSLSNKQLDTLLPITQRLGLSIFLCKAIVGIVSTSAMNPSTGRIITVFYDRLIKSKYSYLHIKDDRSTLDKRIPNGLNPRYV